MMVCPRTTRMNILHRTREHKSHGDCDEVKTIFDYCS